MLMTTIALRRVLRMSALLLCVLAASGAVAEGSRSLYPASYDAAGTRANLDLQPGQRYMDRVIRRGFNYVYARAGEYITLGSSNLADGGDILVYNPQDFGIPGDETLPAAADFTCTGGSATGGPHYSGGTTGRITSRLAELAGPHSPDGTVTVPDGWTPCAYLAPADGIYGILFTVATSGGNPNGRVDQVRRSGNSVAGWEVAVRAAADATADIDGRLFTYAFLGYTGGNNRPVFSTLYYVTSDGYRYRQDLRGLDPNGYALYANTFGFLDDNEPLYKTLRSNNFRVDNLPLGVSAQAAEYPIFFSDISPGAAAAAEAERVLQSLGIPLVPPSPQISGVGFSGSLGGSLTATGVGGTFSFDTTDTVSYEIVISRDGIDFDPANPLNRVLTGIAFSGSHSVVWDGMDNARQAFPARPTPYAYRAFGRNGEVHFPIIDAENNGNPGNPAIPGGGPTITRLNGSSPGDTTVFFDDRGYLTRSGELVGNLNGTLCPGPAPAAASPPEALAGVDSTTSYRLWQFGGNRNSDCASDAGWGDAKGVNLWTYFLTPENQDTLEIQDFPVDVSTAVTTVDTAAAGDTVQGTFSFGNNGTDPANNVVYTMSMTPGLGPVSFGNLPGGASASYDNTSGVVTLTGLPDVLAGGAGTGDMTFSYTAPVSGPVVVNTAVSTSDDDEVPQNNTASASTGIGAVDAATQITGVPASATTGSEVTGSVLYSNVGTDDALDVTYDLRIGQPGSAPTAVSFTALPPGVGAGYDPGTGIVTLSGMPTVLVVGQVLSISFSYQAPAVAGGMIDIASSVATVSQDANPANDSDSASTSFSQSPTAAIQIDARGVCIQDAPYLEYDVTPVDFTPTGLATVELIGSDGGTVSTLVNQPLTGARLLWPEAAVDGSGTGASWPGWEQQDGEWVQVPTTVRPELRVRITVNPTAEVSVTYPPATPACRTEPEVSGVGGPPARPIPALPLPLLLLLVALTAACGRRFLR